MFFRWQMIDPDILTIEYLVSELGQSEIIVKTMESGEKFLQYGGFTIQVGVLGHFAICNSRNGYS